MANDMNLMFASAGMASRDCRPQPLCETRPVCPACGGLECLCRPRFFAGQLLSEDDLNRLDHYIVAKNRLHNRFLFGTGVVCGLEVVCTTCTPSGSNSVVVRPGYALSPCGNDIVVCEAETVDICDLINRCRPRTDDCLDPGRVDRNDRADANNDDDEEWVLTICYKEKPSRGITALRGSSCACGSTGSCGCGGSKSGSGSCGCGGHSHGTSSTYGDAAAAEASCGCGGAVQKTAPTRSAAKSTPRPPQCEPTLTCESYSFAVYKVRPEDKERKVDPGALIKRFICCLMPLFEQVAKFPTNNATQQQLRDWLLDLVEVAREYLVTEGLYDCEIAARLNAVAVPVPVENQQQYLSNWTNATVLVLEILVAVFQKCLCAALLPPCPPSEMNDCVPIATVTVARGRCRVKHICNISNRRFLVTWPALRYWFSWLPLVASWLPGDLTFRRIVERLCCTPIADRFRGVVGNVNLLRNEQFVPPVQPAVAGAAPAAAAANVADRGRIDVVVPGRGDRQVHPFTQILADAFVDRREVDAATLLLAALGATDKENTPLVPDSALNFPGQAMLIHEVLAPAIAPLLPNLGALTGSAANTAKMQQSIETLQKQVEEQKRAIEQLRNR